MTPEQKPEQRIAARALQVVRGLRLGGATTSDVTACLRAADPNFSRFLSLAATDAGLSPAESLTRSTAIFFQYLAVQVSDDLSDKECTYLPEAAEVGPALLLVLQHLFYLTALKAQIPPETLARTARRFLHVGAAQEQEIRASAWDLAGAKRAATGLNSMQFSAYLEILWHGTRLARRAAPVGTHLGIVVHVASDVRSGDRRFVTLPARERKSLIRWAEASATLLEQEQLESVDRVLPTARAAFRTAT